MRVPIESEADARNRLRSTNVSSRMRLTYRIVRTLLERAGPKWLEAYPNLTVFSVKEKSVLFRVRNEVRHGIDAEAWQRLRASGHVAQPQAGIVLLELWSHDGSWSGTILAASFENLGPPIEGINEEPKKVYWPRWRFRSLGAFSALALFSIANGTYRPDVSERLLSAFAPRTKPEEVQRSLWQ